MMNPFIKYEISGVKGEIVAGDVCSFAVKDDMIETVEIIQTDDEICGIKFTLKDTVKVDRDAVAHVTKMAQVFLVNMYGKLQPSIRGFNLKVEQIYDPKQAQTDQIKSFNAICFTDSLRVKMRGHDIEMFKNFFGQKSPHPNADKVYMFLYDIMRVDNIVTRYLMQYELLLNLVAPNHLQKELTAFIKDKYNPTKSFNTIGFHQTRKSGKTYYEDDITYYRNLLAHNDSSIEVTDEKINQFSNALAEVLLFALNRN